MTQQFEQGPAPSKAELDTKAAIIHDTVSGAIASFPDGANNLPVNDLVVGIEPVQDLHGYDNPWPAGGGKNKINYLSCVGVGARNGTDSVYGNGNNTSISGTELTINQAYEDNGGILKGVGTFPIATGEYVTISGKATLTGTSVLTVGISNYDGGGTNNIANTTLTDGRFSVKLDAKSDYAKTGIFLQPLVSGSTAVVSDVMVALGQTEQPYEPYSNICPITGRTGATISHSGADTTDPDEISITFPSEAGTVYGGTLDAVSGELVLTHKYLSDNGSLGWIKNADGSFYVRNPSDQADQDSDGCLCNYAPFNISFSGMNVFFRNNGLISLGTGWGAVYSSADELKNAFASVPIQFVYKLATPITYQLTTQEIRTFLGTNNIWADTGDTSVGYKADTKLYIAKLISELGS